MVLSSGVCSEERMSSVSNDGRPSAGPDPVPSSGVGSSMDGPSASAADEGGDFLKRLANIEGPSCSDPGTCSSGDGLSGIAVIDIVRLLSSVTSRSLRLASKASWAEGLERRRKVRFCCDWPSDKTYRASSAVSSRMLRVFWALSMGAGLGSIAVGDYEIMTLLLNCSLMEPWINDLMGSRRLGAEPMDMERRGDVTGCSSSCAGASVSALWRSWEFCGMVKLDDLLLHGEKPRTVVDMLRDELDRAP